MDVAEMRRLLWRWDSIETQLIPKDTVSPRRTNVALAHEQQGIERQLERVGIAIRYTSPHEFCLTIDTPPN